MAKFPLYKHVIGQWAKTVKGRKYYFGSIKADPKGEAAIKDWHARKDGILAGLDNLRVESTGSGATLLELATAFADVLQHRLKNGQIADETWADYQREIDNLLNIVGPNAIASQIGPAHFTAYYNHLIDTRKLGPHRLATTIRYVRAMFAWAETNGRITRPNYGSEFVAPNTNPESIATHKARSGEDAADDPVFTGPMIDWLLRRATIPFRAMILLALNCGMGPSDLARLRWKCIDFKSGRITLRRKKTGIKREAYLWRKTREALMDVTRLKHNRTALKVEAENALCFLTRKKQPFVRFERVMLGEKIVKTKIHNAISGTFSRWVTEGREEKIIPANAKLTFYTLRSTFRTHADNCTDANAVRRTMGRAIVGSDRRYVRGPMKLRRLKRVALRVKHELWPLTKKPKHGPPPVYKPAAVLKAGQMRLVS